MAKFCTYCGKPLPESGVCDCEESRAAAQQPQQPQQAPAQPLSENVYVKKTKTAVNQSVPFVKEYWKEPMNATLRVLRDKNMALAVVMMVVNAIVAGLLLFACSSKLFNAVKDVLEELVSSFTSMAGVSSPRVDMTIPFFTHLFLGIVMVAVALALSAVVLFVLLKIFKVDASFSYVVMAVGVNTIPCTICLLLALIFVLFGWIAGIVLALLLGAVVWGVLGVLLLTKVFGVKVSGMLVTLISVFFMIVLAINCWANSKLATSAIGKIEVGEMKVEDAIEEIQDQMDEIEVEDIYDDLLNGISGMFTSALEESMYGW